VPLQALLTMWVPTVPAPRVATKGIAMRVLLIEDDSATAQSIELMLKSESFNVEPPEELAKVAGGDRR
jgi:hypothetical protein